MRFVFGSLADYTHDDLIECEAMEIGELRVALQRLVDEIDDFADGSASSYLGRRIKECLEQYKRDRLTTERQP